jgi:5-methylcytosine-specific restriction endonuclease McrA
METNNEIIKKLGDKCSLCGDKNKLEIHNIKPKQKGINNKVSNLILLCHACHRKIRKSNRQENDRKMITLNIHFTNEEYKELENKKEKLNCKNWHDFVMGK